MDTISIRKAKQEELNELLLLNQANVPHVGSIALGRMIHLYNQSSCFQVAEVESTPAGFVIAFGPTVDYDSPNFLFFKERYENFIYIDRIAIADEYRRQGIGTLLYDRVKEVAGERNIPLMSCEYNLWPKNEISRLFHENYGFKEVGKQETEGGTHSVSLQVLNI